MVFHSKSGSDPYGKHDPLLFITYRVTSISCPKRDDVNVGGVTAVMTDQMTRINGFSNMYIGHGIEATHAHYLALTKKNTNQENLKNRMESNTHKRATNTKLIKK